MQLYLYLITNLSFQGSTQIYINQNTKNHYGNQVNETNHFVLVDDFVLLANRRDLFSKVRTNIACLQKLRSSVAHGKSIQPKH